MAKPIIDIKFIHGLTDEALNSLIKRYSKRANSRIERVKREHLWEKSPYIQRQWEPITHTAPVGTPSGRFSRAVSGSREQREEQLKQMVKFLKAKTTVSEVKADIKKFKVRIAEVIGSEPDDDMTDAINRLMARYVSEFKKWGISSDQAYNIISELVTGKGEQGAEETIINAINTATSQDDFMRKVTDDYKYY